jgi:hypothetical protein
MNKPSRGARLSGALTLGTAFLVVSSSMASATAKPPHDYIHPGATVITFVNSPVITSSNTETITSPKVIAEVRSLINSLPVSDTSKMFCPDDLMIPAWVSFSTSKTATPYSRVEFQLGGCPFARVSQHGVAELPTLGGAHLAQVYAKIKTLFAATQ